MRRCTARTSSSNSSNAEAHKKNVEGMKKQEEQTEGEDKQGGRGEGMVMKEKGERKERGRVSDKPEVIT